MKNLAILIIFLFLGRICNADAKADYILANAIELNNSLPMRALSLLQGRRLILLGEVHGSNEMPKAAGWVVKALARREPVLFGIEYPKEIQSDIDRFMKTGDRSILRKLTFFQEAAKASGRSSIAMVELLETLRPLPNVKVFCFDQLNTSGDKSRDTIMAENVLNIVASNPSAVTVTLSGNFHSRLKNGMPEDAEYRFMGAEAIRLSGGVLNLNNVTNVLFRYEMGSVWDCLETPSHQTECGVHDSPAYHTTYSDSVTYDHYFVREPEMTEAHLNSIFLRAVSASEPFH